MFGLEEYWDGRFKTEGKIWGHAPSKTAEHALGAFAGHGVKRLLVLGAGYGRNTRLFSAAGLDVVGVEISGEALAFSRHHDPATKFVKASALEVHFPEGEFDAIYSFNLLHLFRQHSREELLKRCLDWLKPGGLIFFTVFSEKEPSFGKGNSVEPNTFESKPGRPVHYFTEPDLVQHFRDFMILETGLMEDPEDHGLEGPHVHVVRHVLAVAVKRQSV